MARQFLTDIDFNSVAKIVNLPDPTDPQHAATKAYVDAGIEGLNWKDNVRVASTANINLASPGSTLDGVTMVSGYRVLAKDQSSAPENGLYVWNGAAVPMTRAADASTGSELQNAVVVVDEGTANGGTRWRQSEIDITIDTDDVTFESFGASVPSATTTTEGTVELATQTEVNTGTDTTRVVTPETLANWSGRIRKHAADVGDGSSTQFDFTHNFGTDDVQVSVYRNSGSNDDVGVDVSRPDTNTVRLNFAVAPTSAQFRVVIIG